MTNLSIVYVVDDDKNHREAVGTLLKAEAINHILCSSAMEFLSQDHVATGCVLLDVRMPRLSGVTLQNRLTEVQFTLPIIFLTGHAEVPMVVRALKAGAYDFLEKPFNNAKLISTIRSAIELSKERLVHQNGRATQLKVLSQRELEIFKVIVDGHSNKVIGLKLGISQRTVEFHRANIMKKLGTRSLSDLISFCRKL